MIGHILLMTICQTNLKSKEPDLSIDSTLGQWPSLSISMQFQLNTNFL